MNFSVDELKIEHSRWDLWGCRGWILTMSESDKWIKYLKCELIFDKRDNNQRRYPSKHSLQPKIAIDPPEMGPLLGWIFNGMGQNSWNSRDNGSIRARKSLSCHVISKHNQFNTGCVRFLSFSPTNISLSMKGLKIMLKEYLYKIKHYREFRLRLGWV